MSVPQKLPPWLMTALSSDRHISNVLHILSDREFKRNQTRNASRTAAWEQADPSSTPLTRQHLSSFIARRNLDIPSSHAEHYAIATGLHSIHRELNRYTDVIPYDLTRVVVYDGYVGHGAEQNAGTYLNASWVLERGGQKWWIATQAPVKPAAHTFLSVLLQPIIKPPHSTISYRSRVRTVVQLTQNIEGGRRKADSYFPTEVGQSFVVQPEDGYLGPPLKVTLQETRQIDEARCVESTVSILPLSSATLYEQRSGEDADHRTPDDRTIIFKHLLYASWPDHGVPKPEDQTSLLSFIRLVDVINRDTSSCHIPLSSSDEEVDPDPPIMVGCSAGIGRTGSFIALSSLMREYGFLQPALRPTLPSVLPSSPLGPLPDQLQGDKVSQEVDSLREQRPGMVQRPEQVVLIYEALAEAFGLHTQ